MKKIAFIFCLLFSSLIALPNNQEILDLVLEMNFLQVKKKLLNDKIRLAHHGEVNEQLRGMQEMQNYDWEGFVSQLKRAENNENLAESEQQELIDIERRIGQIETETTNKP